MLVKKEVLTGCRKLTTSLRVVLARFANLLASWISVFHIHDKLLGHERQELTLMLTIPYRTLNHSKEEEMNDSTLSYLACCSCGSELSKSKGRLYCTKCGIPFPVVLGRPIIMTRDMVMNWKSPIDEALGISGQRTLMGSLKTLSELGTDRAVEMVLEKQEQIGNITELDAVSNKIRGEMKYRGSGKWFKYADRTCRLLTFPWKDDQDGSFMAFMQAISSSRPQVLLDVASGGGFGVSQQVYLNGTVKQIIAVERDPKCLSNIQYRFKHIGKSRIADAVGGDVRHLPVLSSSVDTAMMLGGLHEIQGISRVLREVYRVLKLGGSFHVLVGEEQLSGEGVSEDDFRWFASVADLYAGGASFVQTASSCGFEVKSRVFSGSEERKRRLVKLTKTG